MKEIQQRGLEVVCGLVSNAHNAHKRAIQLQ